ncbi:MAG: S4 domain-containing protein, partial [Pseudomonadota bacterium]
MTESKSSLIPNEMYGKRIDQVLVELFPDYSRSRLQAWLKSGNITVDKQIVKAKSKVSGGEVIDMQVIDEPEGEWLAENIPLDIHYEDEHLLVLNKPAGLVVHPAVGNRSGTLLNGLLYHHPDLINVPRAGIVHRLDKDTTGLLV